MPRAVKQVAVKKKPPAPAERLPGTNARGERRRAAILEASREVFMQSGYAGASIEAVLEKTGGSKASLYRYFGNKEGLFGDMVAEGCAQFLRDIAIPTRIEGDLESTLHAFGLRFFRLYTDPARVRLMRTIIAEATRFPHLALSLYENGPQRARKELARFFQHCHEQGALHAPDPDIAAIQFITLIKGHCQFRGLFGLSPLAIPVRTEDFIGYSVKMFLHGVAAPQKAKTPPRRSRR